MRRVALVAGASGLIGRRIEAQLAARDWEVVGVARRPSPGSVQRQIAVDLTDAADSRARLAALSAVTHVFYAARYDHPEGIAESEAINTAMLRNLIDAVGAGTPHS